MRALQALSVDAEYGGFKVGASNIAEHELIGLVPQRFLL
jgi:hypothetical protein